MSELNDIPGWPVITIEMGDDAVRVDGEALAVPPGENPREAAIQATARSARLLGRAVRVEAVEADGTVYPLIVTPEGEVSSVGPTVQRQGGRRGLKRKRSSAATTSVPQQPQPASQPPAAPRPVQAAPPVSTPPAPEPTAEPRPLPAAAGPGRASAEPGPSRPSASPEIPPAANAVGTPDPQSGAPTAGAENNGRPPRPNSAQSSTLQAIKAAVQAGESAEALRLATELDSDTEAGGDETAAIAAREVRAYVALRAGRTGEAVRLFAAAALARTAHDAELTDVDVTSPTRWSWRLVQNAHYSWMQVKDPEEAYELSTFVLGAYTAMGAADAPSAEAARGYAEEIRKGLILL
ncbi:hypothetical protein [Yinghuangia sp. YIM S09857]|uniref:hypothetical protein n=1 Tax=Yinghuangia sp. YIM S09857 TaxID=3436929 RepID=UPI003F53B1B8